MIKFRFMIVGLLLISSGIAKGMSCRIVIIDNKVTEILNILNNQVLPKLCSILDGITLDTSEIIEAISASDILLCSKIDNLNISFADVNLEPVLDAISSSDVLLCSKIDNISISDVNLDAVLEAISETDALICTKVGNLDDTGTCLPTLIDVPEDIDNLNASSIKLLKTILLELRGCFDYS